MFLKRTKKKALALKSRASALHDNTIKPNWKPRNTEHFDCSLNFQDWVYLQLFLKWLMNNLIFSISQQGGLQVKTDDKLSVTEGGFVVLF